MVIFINQVDAGRRNRERRLRCIGGKKVIRTRTTVQEKYCMHAIFHRTEKTEEGGESLNSITRLQATVKSFGDYGAELMLLVFQDVGYNDVRTHVDEGVNVVMRHVHGDTNVDKNCCDKSDRAY